MKTIRELRQDKEWTQYDLALKVGVHPQAIYFWESGRRMPLVPQMRKLGELFGMCSDDIALELRPAAVRSRPRRTSGRTAKETSRITSSDDSPEAPS